MLVLFRLLLKEQRDSVQCAFLAEQTVVSDTPAVSVEGPFGAAAGATFALTRPEIAPEMAPLTTPPVFLYALVNSLSDGGDRT